jgi:5-methyltetrahydropteroyltriglutamate--homocysteine methyltransferase
MKRSTNRILTTHVGSLPRPADLIEMYRDQAPAEKLESRLASAVGEVVRQQEEAGIDVVNDGEFGKPMSDEVDYGAWATYVYQRLSGFEMRDLPKDFNLLNSVMGGSKDRRDFAEYYQTPEAYAGPSTRPIRFPRNVGPIRYTGHAIIQRDIRNLKAALVGPSTEEAFMTAVVTGVNIVPGEYFKNPEEQAAAVAEAMREEYQAITDAGLNLQLDDPIIVNVYEWQYSMSGDMAAFRKWAELITR